MFETEKQPLLIPLSIVGLLSLIAVGDLPSEYYLFLRWILSGSAVLVAVMAIRWRGLGWLMLSIPVFVLWFPAFGVYMDKSAWLPLNVLAAIGFITCGAVLKPPTEESSKPGDD